MVEWSDRYVLGVASMDETHHAFVRLLNAAIEAKTEGDFYERCQAMLKHTYNHFEGERVMMVDIGLASKQEHIDEHNRVLREMEFYFSRPKTARSYVCEGIPAWFDNHALTMDADLAKAILAKRKDG